MEISYRTKDTAASMGIQVNYSDVETTEVEDLKMKLIDLGYTYEHSGIPKAFNKGQNTCYFYRKGTMVFGLKTTEEIQSFVSCSKDLLKSYDKKFKPNNLYYYDNN